jgi:ABC-type antimicrobial peptide transport system permease subunit
MRLPLAYTVRNLATRRLTTLLTAGGMALVVFVYTAVLMLDQGLQRTLVATGSPDNVMVTRKGAESEVQSGIERGQASIVESQPQVLLGDRGLPQVSKETVVLINLVKRASDKPSNVVIRGLGARGIEMRPDVRVIAGRPFSPGANEVVAGRRIAERFVGAGLGETLRFGGREWRVVGILDAGGSGFDSEIWGDVDQLMQAFRRPVFSSMVVRLRQRGDLEAFESIVETDPRLTLQAKREDVFYAEQSKALSDFIGYLGLTLSAIFSIGAMIGATITMYASVANRTAEIGTLRALGFRRGSILAAFLIEALLLGALGGAIGVACASLMGLLTFSTTNFQSFAELSFSFELTAAIAVKAMLFAVAMGFVGGFLPAARAARLNIIAALRAA